MMMMMCRHMVDVLGGDRLESGTREGKMKSMEWEVFGEGI